MQSSHHTDLIYHRVLKDSALQDEVVLTRNEHQLSLLQIAAREGQLHNVMSLLMTAPELTDSVSAALQENIYHTYAANKSPLYHAIEKGHIIIARVLLICGADIETAMNLALFLEQENVVSELSTLNVNDALLRILLCFIIRQDAIELLTQVMPFVEQRLLTNRDIKIDMPEEQKSSYQPPENTFCNEDIAGLIEYAAYKNSTLGVEKLLELNVPVRSDIHIRTAGYWAAIHNNNEMFLKVAPTDNDVALTLWQLFQCDKFDELSRILKIASANAKLLFKKYDPASRIYSGDSHHQLRRKDWVAFLTHQSDDDIVWENLIEYEPEHQYVILIGQTTNFYDRILSLENTEEAVRIASEFPGLYAYTISRHLEADKIYISQKEKTIIEGCRLSEKIKINLIQCALQDRCMNFDLQSLSTRSMLSLAYVALGIRYDMGMHTNNFIRISADPTHYIIDFLDSFSQHQLEQTNHWFRNLTHDPAHRSTRLEIRANGQDSAMYERISRQVLLMKYFVEHSLQEQHSQSFFQNRMKLTRKRDIGHSMLTLVFIILTVLCGLWLGNKIPIRLAIRKVMKDALDSKGNSCIIYTDKANNFGCNGYHNDDLKKDRHKIDELCQPYCEELSDIETPWTLSITGIIIFGLLSLFEIGLLLGFNTFRVRGLDRYEDLPVDKTSADLNQCINELTEITQESDALDLNKSQKIGKLRTSFLDKLGLFETTQANLALKLNVHRERLTTRVLIEEIDDEEEHKEEAVASLDNDDLTTSLLRQQRV